MRACPEGNYLESEDAPRYWLGDINAIAWLSCRRGPRGAAENATGMVDSALDGTPSPRHF
jgi:hypothetical protein